MHAWEASVVPLYLGAPEIDEFVPGPYSYIDLRNLNAKEAAELVHHLDRDDVRLSNITRMAGQP